MVRHAIISGFILCFLPCASLAGQTSANFSVGITIGGGASRSPQSSVKTYTWGAAAVSVQNAGFDNPQRLKKSDTYYWFTAERDGGSFRVAVSISSGAVVQVIPV